MPMSGSVVPNIIPNNSSGCGLDFLLNRLRQDPNYRARENNTNQQILNAQRSLDNDSTFLPVVFHIISQSPLAVPDQGCACDTAGCSTVELSRNRGP